MTSIIFFLIFIPILSLILLNVNFIFAPHNPYKEKKTPFECGYHSFLAQNRNQFTISFFVFALLFLLFDLEIVLLYPYSQTSYTNGTFGLFTMIIFTLIVTAGFMFEIGKGALKFDIKLDYKLDFVKLFTFDSKLNNKRVSDTVSLVIPPSLVMHDSSSSTNLVNDVIAGISSTQAGPTNQGFIHYPVVDWNAIGSVIVTTANEHPVLAWLAVIIVLAGTVSAHITASEAASTAASTISDVASEAVSTAASTISDVATVATANELTVAIAAYPTSVIPLDQLINTARYMSNSTNLRASQIDTSALSNPPQNYFPDLGHLLMLFPHTLGSLICISIVSYILWACHQHSQSTLRLNDFSERGLLGGMRDSARFNLRDWRNVNLYILHIASILSLITGSVFLIEPFFVLHTSLGMNPPIAGFRIFGAFLSYGFAYVNGFAIYNIRLFNPYTGRLRLRERMETFEEWPDILTDLVDTGYFRIAYAVIEGHISMYPEHLLVAAIISVGSMLFF